MRPSWLHVCAIVCVLVTVPGAIAQQNMAVVVDAPLAPPAMQALMDLERALQARNLKLARRATVPEKGPAVVVGTANTAVVSRLLADHRITLLETAEALCIRKLCLQGGTLLLICGRDARGLAYALLEAARAVETVGEGDAPLDAVFEMTEAPFLRTRSITVHLCNADLESEWYFAERFWENYLAMLARCRYNNFTLTFSDQTNYPNPIYAYLADVPGFPQVRVRRLTEANRRRNLAMLQRISDLAHARGLDFTLGIWMQQPVPRYVGEVLVEQLPTGQEAANYCAAGLAQVLQTCTAIDGVQFRMNSEAGVPEDQQLEFYRPLFRTIRNCGGRCGWTCATRGCAATRWRTPSDSGSM